MQEKLEQWFLVVGIMATFLVINTGILPEYLPGYGVTIISAVLVLVCFIYSKKIFTEKDEFEKKLYEENKKEILEKFVTGLDCLDNHIEALNENMENNFQNTEQLVERKSAEQEKLIVDKFELMSELVKNNSDSLYETIMANHDDLKITYESTSNQIINKFVEMEKGVLEEIKVSRNTSHDLMVNRTEKVLDSIHILHDVTETSVLDLKEIAEKNHCATLNKCTDVQETLENAIKTVVNRIAENKVSIEEKIEMQHKVNEETIIDRSNVVLDSLQMLRTALTAEANEKYQIVIAKFLDLYTAQDNNLNSIRKQITETDNNLISRIVSGNEMSDKLSAERFEDVLELIRNFKAEVESYNNLLINAEEKNFNTITASYNELKKQNDYAVDVLNSNVAETKVNLLDMITMSQALTDKQVMQQAEEVMAAVQELRKEAEMSNKNAKEEAEKNNETLINLIGTNKADIEYTISIMQDLLVQKALDSKEATALSEKAIIENNINTMNQLIDLITEARNTYLKELNTVKEETADRIEQVSDRTNEIVLDEINMVNHTLNDFRTECTLYAKDSITLNEQNIDKLIAVINNNATNINTNIEEVKQLATEESLLTRDVLESTKQQLNENIVGSNMELSDTLRKQTERMDDQMATFCTIVTETKDSILENTNKSFESQMQRVEEMFAENENHMEMINENTVNKLTLLNSALSTNYNAIDEKISTVTNILSSMKKDLSKQFGAVLDTLDENIEVRNKNYNRLFKQTQDFSIAVDKVLKNLKNDIIDNQNQLSKQESESNEKIIQIYDLIIDDKTALNTMYGQMTIQQNAISYTLDEVQHKVALVDDILDLLKTKPKENTNQKAIDVLGLNPNRIEEITDAGSGMTVVHVYNDGRIVSSKMKSKNNKLVYERNYAKNGILTNAKSYDNNGHLVTELTYWSNGQVKERIEYYDKNGSKQKNVTKFNDKGQIIK